MFRDVPVQAAIVGCCALGDVYARYAESLFGYLGWSSRGLGNGEVSRDQDEFIVWSYCVGLGLAYLLLHEIIEFIEFIMTLKRNRDRVKWLVVRQTSDTI